jgi:hypothetical protein
VRIRPASKLCLACGRVISVELSDFCTKMCKVSYYEVFLWSGGGVFFGDEDELVTPQELADAKMTLRAFEHRRLSGEQEGDLTTGLYSSDETDIWRNSNRSDAMNDSYSSAEPPAQWGDEMRESLKELNEAQEKLGDLHRWVSSQLTAADVWPRVQSEDARELFLAVHERLENAIRAASASFKRYSGSPLECLFSHGTLSREQHYILLAMGATEAELPTPSFGSAAGPGLGGSTNIQSP